MYQTTRLKESNPQDEREAYWAGNPVQDVTVAQPDDAVLHFGTFNAGQRATLRWGDGVALANSPNHGPDPDLIRT